ncbi:MAG TPA: tRNA epoxyqueuosine(34) reductase QueG, partial [Acidobacteriaceae bacterium]|nr:tRNA epoxyqueuosine(34) reductase QueG [Acidobacteriaceae bacterium]
TVPDPSEAAADDQRFAGWVASGAAGEMDWLTRRDPGGNLVRGDLRRSVPWARSVLVCAVNYNTAAPRSIDPAPSGTGWIARYAWSGQGTGGMAPPDGDAPQTTPGSDYHEELLPKLKAIAAQLKDRFACETRAYVDTGPILERGYAARAGVGWIGRNTCVLNQQLGSWLLLGVVVTSLDLAPEAVPVPAADRCGTCTRCIDACPTDALHGSGLEGSPRLMDASRCIAYLTIEKKGSIDPELREGVGRQVFGCDICQDVCPWNRRAPVGASGMLEPRHALVNPSLAWLATLDGPAFNRWFRGSPLERTRRKRLLRNVAIAMGNSREAGFRQQLETWTGSEDPVLAQTAAWALARLSLESAPSLIPSLPLEPEAASVGPLD